MLRLLGGSKASSSSSSSSKTPVVSIHVPAFGGVFLDAPTESGSPDEYIIPGREYRMTGEVEVEMPIGFGRKRCRAVRVGFRTTISLDLGPGRMGEEDVLYDFKGDVLGGAAEGLWLEEGSQKFDFTILIPSNLAPHDWHTNGSIEHKIYAEVEGLPIPPAATTSPKSVSSSFKRRSPAASRSPSRSPHSHGSRNQSRSTSPAPAPPLNLDVITAALSLDGSQTSLPVLPAYQDLEQDDDWLYGTCEAKRTSMLVYNPKPQGGVTELDERSNGFVPGLGIWETQLFSDAFSVSALLEAKLRVSSIQLSTTIFAFRVTLAQKHTIISPRDDLATAKPVTSTRYFVILEEGKKPPQGHLHPGTDCPTIWRGIGAEGRDTGNLDIRVKGRLPSDSTGRPSTLPGVVTPIRVSHTLHAEVFFSVYGEDEKGRRMPVPGAGGLRLLRINRPVLVPSCAMMPHAVDPPAYDEAENLIEPYRDSKYDKPCSVCGTRPSKRFCETCPKDVGLHPRHDHDPKKVGDPQGRCPLCSKNVMPTGPPRWNHQHNADWHFCACGMPLEEMDGRMRERERRVRDGANAGSQDLKVEAEQRGRSRRAE